MSTSTPLVTDNIGEKLSKVAAYLREEADFNRSWTDGRRESTESSNPVYVARRLEIATERDEWADAIDTAILSHADFPNRLRAARLCDWSQDGDEDSDTWHSDCGHYFTLTEGHPIDNGFRFCPICGASISVTPLVWDGESTVFGSTVFPPT
jgi:hypothetical protein